LNDGFGGTGYYGGKNANNETEKEMPHMRRILRKASWREMPTWSERSQATG